jgi:hypothetical protein
VMIHEPEFRTKYRVLLTRFRKGMSFSFRWDQQTI